MIRRKRHEALDAQLESMDDGGLIEGGADVRARDRHRCGAVAAGRLGRAVNAPPLAILAKRACRRDVFGLMEQVGCLALPGRPRRASSHNGDDMSMKERLTVTTGPPRRDAGEAADPTVSPRFSWQIR
jgi:hypothetical protein